MIHRLRRLGLAGVAALALSLAVASTSSALPGELDVGTSPAILAGHSDPKGDGTPQYSFFTSPGTLVQFFYQCKTATYAGTTQGQLLSDITLTPTYGECTTTTNPQVPGASAAGIKLNGCKYTVTTSPMTPGTGLVDIVGCTVGKQIQIQLTNNCAYAIPEQAGLSHVTYKAAGADELTFEWTLQGITVTQISSMCPQDKIGHHSNAGSLTGNTIFKAFKHGATQQVQKHGHTYTEVTNGEQVSLIAT